MKHLILSVLFVVSMSIGAAFGTGITTDQLEGFSKLTEQQKADIAKQVADAASVKITDTSVGTVLQDPEKLEKWVKFGASIGQGIGGAAKEIGMATNEFVNTPVGKLAVGLIVWKVMGHEVTHIVGAGIFALVWISIWLYLFRRLCVIKSTTYTAVANSFRRTKTTEHFEAGEAEDCRAWMLGLLVVLTGVTIVMAFSY